MDSTQNLKEVDQVEVNLEIKNEHCNKEEVNPQSGKMLTSMSPQLQAKCGHGLLDAFMPMMHHNNNYNQIQYHRQELPI